VIHGCATARGRHGSTWLTPGMIDAYQELHRRGQAHSIEVWHDGKLAGGVYGVAIGAMFAGESMFHRVRDASKVALVHLVAHLQRQGYLLFDIQQLNPHTASMGGSEIPRSQYLKRLAAALRVRLEFGHMKAATDANAEQNRPRQHEAKTRARRREQDGGQASTNV
jgi:leucyl/phenylalanyl-tRNA--protein transferase